MSYTTFIICRHGETDANVKKVLSGGNSNHPLNEKGRNDASKLAEFLKQRYPEGFDAYFSSDLVRSIDTAKIAFGQYLKDGEIPITALRKLQEIRHGEKEEIPVSQREDAWNKFVSDYIASHSPETRDPFYKWNNTPFANAGSETQSHLIKRVKKALNSLAEGNPGKKLP